MNEKHLSGDMLDTLFEVIINKRSADPEKSYTAKLFSRGLNKIAQKFGEEAVETVIAATGEGKAELVSESADLLYHLLVLWAGRGVTPSQVWARLAERKGVSGIDEKRLRRK